VHPATSNKVMTAAQRDWMSTTRLPLVRVVLHRQDEAASALLQTVNLSFHQQLASMQLFVELLLILVFHQLANG